MLFDIGTCSIYHNEYYNCEKCGTGFPLDHPRPLIHKIDEVQIKGSPDIDADRVSLSPSEEVKNKESECSTFRGNKK